MLQLWQPWICPSPRSFGNFDPSASWYRMRNSTTKSEDWLDIIRIWSKIMIKISLCLFWYVLVGDLFGTPDNKNRSYAANLPPFLGELDEHSAYHSTGGCYGNIIRNDDLNRIKHAILPTKSRATHQQIPREYHPRND